jgi:hypothetical protein
MSQGDDLVSVFGGVGSGARKRLRLAALEQPLEQPKQKTA